MTTQNIFINDSIKIQRLQKSDFGAFSQLRLEALQNAPTSFASSYEEEKENGMKFFKTVLQKNKQDNCIFGAFVGDKIIGMVGLYQEKQMKLKHKCHIWGMYVQPTYQKQGVGKALLETAINYAKNELGCLMINLSVEANNSAAKNLYKSCGFKVWGKEPKAKQVDGKFYDVLHLYQTSVDKEGCFTYRL